MGKALGLPEDLTKTLSSQVWGWSEGVEQKHAEGLNLNMGDRRLRLALELAHQLVGIPRHLSQLPGGFVLTRDRLDELVPIEPAAMADRQVIEWDIQREGKVVHLIAHHLTDLTSELASVGSREAGFPLPHGRGDELHHGAASAPDPRDLPKAPRSRNVIDPYGHLDEIRVKARDFR